MKDQLTGVEEPRYFALMGDGGPVYTEFNPEYIIVEPWNAFSSILILLPAVYWAYKLRGQFANHLFLAFCIPLLFLGGLGSTLFHAFRASPFFLYMDVVPTAVLTLAISVYFWIKVLPKWWQIFGIIVPAIGVRFSAFYWLSPHSAVNLSYAITGILLFTPIVLLLRKIHFRYAGIIGGSIVLFVLALMFREMDAWNDQLLPMGTHFIWHILTGLGGFFLAEFLYRFRKLEKPAG